jgi:hypothetical protein
MSKTILTKDSEFDAYVDLVNDMLIKHAAAWGLDLAYINDHFKVLRAKWNDFHDLHDVWRDIDASAPTPRSGAVLIAVGASPRT